MKCKGAGCGDASSLAGAGAGAEAPWCVVDGNAMKFDGILQLMNHVIAADNHLSCDALS
jgi:hypothetical protein